jgi:hypothetical protein
MNKREGVVISRLEDLLTILHLYCLIFSIRKISSFLPDVAD